MDEGGLAAAELTELLVTERDDCVAGSEQGQDATHDCAHVAATRLGVDTERARALIEAHDEMDAEDAEIG